MTTPFRVPLVPAQPQRLSLSMAGTIYQLTLKWCAPARCWVLDIADSASEPIVTGIPLVTGASLLEQYGYLGIGGALVPQTDHDANAVPTFDNLGDTGNLYFVTS